jgi:hypothetical protein
MFQKGVIGVTKNSVKKKQQEEAAKKVYPSPIARTYTAASDHWFQLLHAFVSLLLKY